MESQIQEGSSTLQHAVIGLSISPPQCIPESQGLWPFITFVNRHLAAAVQPCLQRTPKRHKGRVNSVPLPQTQLTQTCWPLTLVDPTSTLQACCTLHINTGTLKNYQKRRWNFNSISCSIWIPFPDWRRCSHEFSVGILTACFCNGYCPPCMVSQVNFLFLFHKAGF